MNFILITYFFIILKICELPDDLNITELDLSYKGLTECPDLSRYTKLIKLDISNNQLTHLDNLPDGLQKLCCNFNQLIHLDNLPYGLQELYCSGNQLSHIDNLPHGLQILYCNHNKLTHVDNLPYELQELYCSKNPMKYEFEPTLDNIRKHNQN